MRGALRSVAAVVVGFIAASIVIMIVETINGRILYPELAKAADDVTDRETIRALLTFAGVANNLMVPPPSWFWITSLVVLMPAAYVGARLAPKR